MYQSKWKYIRDKIYKEMYKSEWQGRSSEANENIEIKDKLMCVI